MIHYQLRCRAGHDFEAWFKDGATFDRQRAGGQVTCPYCGTARVAKAPMAPRLGNIGNHDAARPAESHEARASQVAAKILQAVEGIRREVEETCEYVGDEFAQEARRIHKGEADERGIYGEATKAEAEKLDDEGVEVVPLPFLRSRKNN